MMALQTPTLLLERPKSTDIVFDWTNFTERQVNSDSLNPRSERPQGPLTDLERREFYLREGERLAHMGSWSLKPDGIFDYLSPGTFVIFGLDPNQSSPTLSQWLGGLFPDDRREVACLIRRKLCQGAEGDIQ